MNGHEFGTVWKGGFHLYLVYHLPNTFHNLIAVNDSCAVPHQIRDRVAVACAFNHIVTDQSNRFGIVQFYTSCETFAGEFRSNGY